MEDYIASLEDSSFLLDKLCRRSYTLDIQGPDLFPCHLTPVEVHDGISAGKLVQGTFLASRENFLEGNVNIEGREKPVRCIIIREYLITVLMSIFKKSLNIYFKNNYELRFI